MSEVSKDHFKDMATGINHAYFDLNPPMTRADDWWAMRMAVPKQEDAVVCLGRCARQVKADESLAQSRLPGANFVFQAGNIPDMMIMLGQILDAQMERNHLHYDQMSQYREDD
jgi:hypothetical protein